MASKLVSGLLQKTLFEIPVLLIGAVLSLWVTVRMYGKQMRKFRDRGRMVAEDSQRT